MTERFKLIGGILNIVLDNNKVLMLLRKNKFDAGLYSLPGGCLEDNETIKDAAKREVKEETNLDVNTNDMFVASSMHRICKSGWQSIEYVIVSKKFNGELKLMEPDKSSELKWFDINNLPSNISPYAKKAIYNYLNKEIFSEIDY